MSLSSIAAAVWSNQTRTLQSGAPPTPVTRIDYICQAVWQYISRTLTVYDYQLLGGVCNRAENTGAFRRASVIGQFQRPLIIGTFERQHE